jgi:hypothetical protein
MAAMPSAQRSWLKREVVLKWVKGARGAGQEQTKIKNPTACAKI